MCIVGWLRQGALTGCSLVEVGFSTCIGVIGPHVVLCVDTHGRGSPLVSLWWPHAIMNKWFINLCWMDVVSICYMYVLCVCPSRFALCLVSGSLPFSKLLSIWCSYICCLICRFAFK